MMEGRELEDGSSDETTIGPFKMSPTESDLESPAPRSVSMSDCVTFVRKKDRYRPREQYRLENSLLAGVGFLELANAGDFAANVWNEAPVPVFAAVLMALGGTLALGLSYFAFKDARLSWRNVLLLRQERRCLRMKNANEDQDTRIARDIQLDINLRELGMEVIDRIGMDTVMGLGAVVVGIGTFMAIGGANPRVFYASNLMSGYIGNAPVAFYGTINAGWSLYVWRRAHRHHMAGTKKLTSDMAESLLKRRSRTVKTHANINGVIGIVAGAASLVTATMWYGYPILVPCIILSAVCNYIWRSKIGYGRRLVRQPRKVDQMSLLEELELVDSFQRVLKETPSESLVKLIPDSESIASVFEFLVQHDLFDDFCLLLLEDPSLLNALVGSPSQELTIGVHDLLNADKLYFSRFREIAQTSISQIGLIRFQDRQRHLLETLGCYLCTPGVATKSEKY